VIDFHLVTPALHVDNNLHDVHNTQRVHSALTRVSIEIYFLRLKLPAIRNLVPALVSLLRMLMFQVFYL